MVVTFKQRKPGELTRLTRQQAITKKIVDKFGKDVKSQHTAEQKVEQTRKFTYKLPEQVFKDFLCKVLDLSLSALNVRIRAHKIPPPDGKDGRNAFWHRNTIQSYLDETKFERENRIMRAREAVRQRAAEKYAAQGGGSTQADALAIVDARIAAIPKEGDSQEKPRRAKHLRVVGKD